MQFPSQEKILHFHYKDQPLNVVQGDDHYLFLEKHDTQIFCLDQK
jgi:hypothetical protein